MKIQAFVLALGAFLAVPASAAVETRQQGVQYRDLDLTTEAGRTELDRRLDSAAREVCGMDEAHVGSRIKSSESRRCYRDARRQLADQVAALTEDAATGA